MGLYSKSENLEQNIFKYIPEKYEPINGKTNCIF
jgi:hypothetical protein